MTRQEEDLALLNKPDEWTNWPVLPVVKRGEGWPTAGLLIAPQGGIIGKDTPRSRTVYEFNMWALETGPLSPQLEGATKHTYPSYEAMLADGWEVD